MILIFIFVLAVLCFIAIPGKKPQNVGLQNLTKLADCDEQKQNCVSSKATTAYHTMIPWMVLNKSEFMKNLAKIIKEDPQSNIIIQNEKYIYAQYQSNYFKFIDDVEFILTDNNEVHFRSSSRLGRKDFKVNRKRILKLHDKLLNLGLSISNL